MKEVRIESSYYSDRLGHDSLRERRRGNLPAASRQHELTNWHSWTSWKREKVGLGRSHQSTALPDGMARIAPRSSVEQSPCLAAITRFINLVSLKLSSYLSNMPGITPIKVD